MIKNLAKTSGAILVLTILALPMPAAAAIADLIGSLTSGLGVSEAQATGGAGAIFGLAQQNMTGNDFGTITDAIPGITGLLSSAPAESEGASSMLGGAMSTLGSNESASGLTGLGSSFSNLGMGTDMIGQFVPIVLDFVETQAGPSARALMQAALG